MPECHDSGEIYMIKLHDRTLQIFSVYRFSRIGYGYIDYSLIRSASGAMPWPTHLVQSALVEPQLAGQYIFACPSLRLNCSLCTVSLTHKEVHPQGWPRHSHI